MNPWVILGVVLAWLGSLGAVGWWQNDAGHTAERSAWQERERVELVTLQDTVARLEAEKDALEQKVIADVAKIDREHQQEAKNAALKAARDVAAARAGALTLRLPCERPLGEGAGRAATAESGTTPGGPDGSGTGQSLREFTAVVVGIAHDADRLAGKVNSLQALVRTYYNACGASPAAGPAPAEPAAVDFLLGRQDHAMQALAAHVEDQVLPPGRGN